MPTQEITIQTPQTFPHQPYPRSTGRHDDLFLEDCQSEAGGCHPTDDGQSGFAPDDDPKVDTLTAGTAEDGVTVTTRDRVPPLDIFQEDCQSEAGGCHPTDDGQSGFAPDDDGYGEAMGSALIETWSAPAWPPAF